MRLGQLDQKEQKDKCSLKISVAVKTYHDHGNPFQRKHFTEIWPTFRGLVHCDQVWKYGCIKERMVWKA